MSVRRWVARVVALSLAMALLPAGAASARTDKIGAARARAHQLRVKMNKLQEQSARAVAEYEATEAALEVAVAEHFAAQDELDRAENNSTDATDVATNRLRAIYMSGGPIMLYASVLQASSPHDAFARVANINAVVGADSETVSAALSQVDSAAAAHARLRAAAFAQVRLEERASRERQRVEALFHRQERLVRGADRQVRALIAAEQRRVELARQRAREAEAERLARSGNGPSSGGGGAPYRPAGGQYSCPVGPNNHFIDTWHAPRSGGRLHLGTDVFAPWGSPEYAVTSGVIDKWSYGGLGGIAIWLRADNGDRYYYAHNSRNVAKVGTRVHPGQVIAYVGNTGNARTTPSHVHFEAHPGGGAAANPYPFLARICGKL